MIISGNSDARVLVDQQDNGGLKNFFVFVVLFSSNFFCPLAAWKFCSSRESLTRV